MTSPLVALDTVHRREVAWLRHGTIPRGMPSILAGHPGLGKSLWTLRLAAELSHEGLNTVVCSAEDSLEYSIKPRIEACAADPTKIHALIPRDDEGNARGVTFPSDALLLQEAILSVEAVLVIIDPVAAHIDHDVDSHKDASLRTALAPLSRIAEETLAAVLCVYHLNKTTSSSDPMMRVGGSIGGPGQARSCLLIDRDPDDPDKDRGNRRVLAHFKCNVGSLQPSRLLEVRPVLLPATDLEPEVHTAAILDIGESPHSAGAILGSNNEDRTAMDEAVEFLHGELDGGISVSTKTILKRARELGISERTLRRAKTTTGVIAERAGFGNDGAWTWRIPLQTNGANPHRLPNNGDGLAAFDASRARARAGGHGLLAAYGASNTPNPVTEAELSKAAKKDCDLAANGAETSHQTPPNPQRLPSPETPLRARAREADAEDDPFILNPQDDDIPF